MSQTLTLPTEIKANSAGGFEGYGSVFGNVDLGGDIVAQGAFRESLEKRMPAMLWSHDPSQVVGKYTKAVEDENGLLVAGEFANTNLGNTTRTLVKMGAVSGLSIGFSATDIDYNKDGMRVIKQAELFEVSVVAMPMNEAARVSMVKSYTGGSERELEYLMRDAGCTREHAKQVVSSIFTREAPEDDDAWLKAFRAETEQARLEVMCNAIKGA